MVSRPSAEDRPAGGDNTVKDLSTAIDWFHGDQAINVVGGERPLLPGKDGEAGGGGGARVLGEGGRRLLLPGADPDRHSGRYHCRVHNPAGEVRKLFDVLVLGLLYLFIFSCKCLFYLIFG